jgi:RTX toxin RtxA
MIGGGTANIFTKVGNGITLAAMVGSANIFTHIGNGVSVAFINMGNNVGLTNGCCDEIT